MKQITHHYRGVKYGLTCIVLVIFSSCIATPKIEDATIAFYQKATKIVATTGIDAFAQTFYPFAKQNCASCHGSSQAPLFASSNLSDSYAEANDPNYVSFTSPGSSKLAIYSGNGHCGVGSCQGNLSTATELIKLWGDAEIAILNGGGEPGPVIGGGPLTGGLNPGASVTTTIPIPSGLPMGANYVPMRWPLAQLSPSSSLVGNAIFELEIQKLSSTTYRVRNPKIAGLPARVKFSGIHVFIKPSSDSGIGVEDLGAGSVWEDDVVNVAATTLPGTLPNGPLSVTTFVPLNSFSMVIGIRSNQDSLTIALDKIEPGVTIMPTFSSINTNIIIPKCLNCHTNGNALGGVNYSSYANTLATVTTGNPAASAFYTSVSGVSPEMPTGSLKLTTGEQNAISTWITNGALNN